jgi:hypothetical protein
MVPGDEDGKVVSPTHRPPPGNIPGINFCKRLSRPQGHSAAGRLMSVKNSNEIAWNRTRDILACSAVPQPNVKVKQSRYWPGQPLTIPGG